MTDRTTSGGYAYLIHLDAPLTSESGKRVKTATHYIGAAGNLGERIRSHSVGTGSRFLREVNRRGIAWRVVRSWRFDSRRDAFTYEAALKARKQAADFCPVCRAAKGLPPLSLPVGGPPRLVLVRHRGEAIAVRSRLDAPTPAGTLGHFGRVRLLPTERVARRLAAEARKAIRRNPVESPGA